MLGLLTSCRHPNKSSDIQAHETLVHVQALLQSDSFPENDSLLTPSIRFFTQHGPDSLLAQTYYLQGEILRHHHFMLRASDAYIKALELCPDSSQLRFRIHLAQAKTCRIEKIASEAAHHLNLAGRLLPALRHQGCRTDFLHEKAMLCLLRQDTNAATRYFKAVTDASAPHSAVSRQTADVTFPCRLTCETGLHYRWMRGTLKGPMPYNGLHFRLDRMDYLQLPLAVGYRFCPMPHFTLTPKIGGYVALGLKADGWIEGTDHYQQPFGAAADLFRHTRIPADYRPFNRFDSGILTGVGLTYRHLGLDVSYQLGLTHLAATYDSRLQQRSWNISLSYRFR